MINRIKQYWISFQIFILKNYIAFETWYEEYKQKRLERYVTAQILISYNYDIKAIKALNKLK
jgi:hypothetical protein